MEDVDLLDDEAMFEEQELARQSAVANSTNATKYVAPLPASALAANAPLRALDALAQRFSPKAANGTSVAPSYTTQTPPATPPRPSPAESPASARYAAARRPRTPPRVLRSEGHAPPQQQTAAVAPSEVDAMSTAEDMCPPQRHSTCR